MKKQLKMYRSSVVIVSALLCLSCFPAKAQLFAVAMANADTSRFSANRLGGWQLLNSFVAPVGTDSAQLEVIIQNADTLNWDQPQWLGRIKGLALIPSSVVNAPFFILNNQYQLNILPDGRCSVRILNGGAPGIPAVIPLRVVYKL